MSPAIPDDHRQRIEQHLALAQRLLVMHRDGQLCANAASVQATHALMAQLSQILALDDADAATAWLHAWLHAETPLPPRPPAPPLTPQPLKRLRDAGAGTGLRRP